MVVSKEWLKHEQLGFNNLFRGILTNINILLFSFCESYEVIEIVVGHK